MIGQCVIVQQCSTKTVDGNFMQLETGLAIQIISLNVKCSEDTTWMVAEDIHKG